MERCTDCGIMHEKSYKINNKKQLCEQCFEVLLDNDNIESISCNKNNVDVVINESPKIVTFSTKNIDILQDDNSLVECLDDLMYKSKNPEGITPLANKFICKIREFIKENELGNDQHCFVALPETEE